MKENSEESTEEGRVCSLFIGAHNSQQQCPATMYTIKTPRSISRLFKFGNGVLFIKLFCISWQDTVLLVYALGMVASKKEACFLMVPAVFVIKSTSGVEAVQRKGFDLSMKRNNTAGILLAKANGETMIPWVWGVKGMCSVMGSIVAWDYPSISVTA